MKQRILLLHEALEQSWSSQSSSLWTEDNPACGQCGVTSLVVHDYTGGEIAKTMAGGRWHFYNIISGVRIDFTSTQFSVLPHYEDRISSREEAMLDTNEVQYTYLKQAVQEYIEKRK
ncbi:hypothetical protein FZW96_18640 [Bacillus sp. BGMRC 2118]|nr:hypothetical protein FZW96_18640 [Bacillus sp. BGMRC 2118]